MSDVLDTSALLAFLKTEPGQEIVAASIKGGAKVCTANLCELMTVLIRNGMPEHEAAQFIADLPAAKVVLSFDLAMRAGALVVHTAAHSLSMGGRICLALGGRDGGVVVTADRVWADVASAIGVTVKLIRTARQTP